VSESDGSLRRVEKTLRLDFIYFILIGFRTETKVPLCYNANPLQKQNEVGYFLVVTQDIAF